MRKYFLILNILISFFTIPNAYADCKKQINIAVIDSGFGYLDKGHSAKLCAYGHADFTKEQKFSSAYATKDHIPEDMLGHGTNIVGIIDDYLNKTNINYCFTILKYYTGKQIGSENVNSSNSAISYATQLKADYINYSGGGPGSDPDEKAAVKSFLDSGGAFISAAGNEAQDIDDQENRYYPAQEDPRVIVVGSLNLYGVRSKRSNFGYSVNRWELGENLNGFGITMSGTSQATALATAKIIIENNLKCEMSK